MVGGRSRLLRRLEDRKNSRQVNPTITARPAIFEFRNHEPKKGEEVGEKQHLGTEEA